MGADARTSIRKLVDLRTPNESSRPPLPFSWLRNGASGLRVRHDFPLLLLMIRGGVTGSEGIDGPLASPFRLG